MRWIFPINTTHNHQYDCSFVRRFAFVIAGIQSGTCYRNLSSVTRKSFQINVNQKRDERNTLTDRDQKNALTAKREMHWVSHVYLFCQFVRPSVRPSFRITVCSYGRSVYQSCVWMYVVFAHYPIQCCELSNNCQPLRAVNQKIHETNKYITSLYSSATEIPPASVNWHSVRRKPSPSPPPVAGRRQAASR